MQAETIEHVGFNGSDNDSWLFLNYRDPSTLVEQPIDLISTVTRMTITLVGFLEVPVIDTTELDNGPLLDRSRGEGALRIRWGQISPIPPKQTDWYAQLRVYQGPGDANPTVLLHESLRNRLLVKFR